MKILLYSPDNAVTRRFMPQLWMFLIQELTPPSCQVLLLDGNARPMSERQLVRFVRNELIGLVGISAVTRLAAKAYKMADAIRAIGVPVVMGGPHVSALPDEALGQSGGPRHVDSIVVGEADEIWPRIVEDAARGRLQEVYQAVDESGRQRKPSLQPYPTIHWDTLDLDQFNVMPRPVRPILRWAGNGWGSFQVIPVESARGCPYRCEFCAVTEFFGDTVRHRSNESVIDELLRLKARARKDRGRIVVFFVDDNFAVNKKRTMSLLHDIIDAKAQVPWLAQISPNLLQDEELIEVIAESGGQWLFLGIESIEPPTLAGLSKSFNKPDEYRAVLRRLARRNIYAVTSFIFGTDQDTPGVADRTLREIRRWPPGLPVFSQLTPYPGTALYRRLEISGRLARATHWMDFAAFEMAHKPARMTMAEVKKEIHQAWSSSYSPESNAAALESIRDRSSGQRAIHLIGRMIFRGLYFPQKNRRAWLRVLLENRRSLFKLLGDCLGTWAASHRLMRWLSIHRARRDGS